LRRRRRSWNLFKQVLLVPCHRRLSYAGCDGYEVAFANPENNKTGLLDNDLSKKITSKTINMDKGAKKYGKIYEISLPNGMFTYICRVRQYEFGIFDYLSEKTANTDELLSVGFKTYKACIETAIRKKIWKLIGQVNLEKENITFPDLAIFLSYNKELFIRKSRVIRNGNPLVVPQKDYIDLLKRGYIYGFFDDYKIFELWLSSNIENYPESEGIFPLPSQYL